MSNPHSPRIPPDEARSGRRTTVRRPTDPAPAVAVPEPAPAPAVAAPAAPNGGAPGLSPRSRRPPPVSAMLAGVDLRDPNEPRLDGAALMAELDALTDADMARLLGGGAPTRVRTGDAVEGVIVRVGREGVFVDMGAKSEGVLDLAEFTEGGPPVIGQRLTAFVLSADERGVRLARRLSGKANIDALEQAREAGVPVEGTVESRNQGGFVVKVGGVRAFCPISQIDRIPAPDLDSYIGQKLQFLVTEIRGRDAVVSRKALAAEEVAAAATELWDSVQEGDLKEGVVTGSKEFGVFVDIGGIQGLVAKRELGWDPQAVAPATGDRVTVRVLSVDREARRLSLSMRDPESSPWARVGVDFVEGEVYTGQVTRLTDFGAFVRLAPGLEGLVPMRHLSDKRVNSASEATEVGATVPVRLLSIDSARQRLELSLRVDAKVEARPAGQAHERVQIPKDTGSLGTLASVFGAIKVKTRR
ncbi:MAG: S1 RNA-binding domain-containing protein [Deltaproteobacteria bacterium]|nr:S1 RNA-binding domain-containing protein [Deltaproteobacteria bacterium]